MPYAGRGRNSIPVTIDQTAVAGNFASGSIPQDYCGILESTTNSEIDNIDVAFIKNIIGTTNLLDSIANLNALADNGGKGQRHPKSNRPKTGSLLIDATASANSALGGQDQGYHSRGVDRIPARPGLSNYNFDIGAVEF
ncbi:MAG: hypothetical protein ABUS79_02580 [Pseudomonadota bacterium]